MTNKVNDMQRTYNYAWPGLVADCAAGACGNTSLQFPGDPLNLARRPVPTTVEYNTGSVRLDEHVRTTSFYGEDQWTWNRFTFSGALRYDHATSGYGESCVGPNQFVPNPYCTSPSDGVNYNDVTPRWGAVWDVRGNGKTAVKWNMGKYLNAATISGIYQDLNPARRTVNGLTRNWGDANGNRVVDCDLMNFSPNGECTTFSFIAGDFARFGKDPLSLDAAGNAVGLNTIACGRTEKGINPALQAYCNQYGDSLLEGWGRRRSEWQFGLGIQHELLPRLSAELTYNRRSYFNILVSDQLGIGCDRFNGAGAGEDLSGRKPGLHEPVVRLLHGDRAHRSAAAQRRRLHDPRPERHQDDGASRPAHRPDVHGRAELQVERRRHQLQLARTERDQRSGRHEHRPHAA